MSAAGDTHVDADPDQAESRIDDPEADLDVEPEISGPAVSIAPEGRQEDQQTEGAASQKKEALKLANFLTAMDIRASRFDALKQALDLWQIPIEDQPYLNSLDDDQAFFRLTTKPKGVSIHRLETDLDLLKNLNLPAILEFFPTGSEAPGYLTLSRIEGDSYIFGGADGNAAVASTPAEINFYWSGIAYVPWKNYLSIWGIIPRTANKDSIITLKLLLHELGYGSVTLNEEYDAATRRAIEGIQAKYGLPVDGFVGPLTKIILYQEKNDFEMPRLIQ